MSHQRYPSDAVKEPHSISLRVLRLSRPSLVAQNTVRSPLAAAVAGEGATPASLAYSTGDGTNCEPFIMSPVLNLPPSFGSAYVGETFSCTLCANYDTPDVSASSGARLVKGKQVRDVRIEAEMKTPASPNVVRLDLGPDYGENPASGSGIDLEDGQTLQKVVNFDLKEEGNHVLAVTVSYYEATDISGRTRTFRKLYQFICKTSLIVRTKASALHPSMDSSGRRWVLEAQLENCSEDAIQLERVIMNLEPGLVYSDCNWDASGSHKPVLHPSEVEQVCFVVQEASPPVKDVEGKMVFGVLGIGWRGEMGNRGFLSTGKLGTRFGA